MNTLTKSLYRRTQLPPSICGRFRCRAGERDAIIRPTSASDRETATTRRNRASVDVRGYVVD
eukprot:8874775-Pyramimonas_sp.AAC.1